MYEPQDKLKEEEEEEKETLPRDDRAARVRQDAFLGMIPYSVIEIKRDAVCQFRREKFCNLSHTFNRSMLPLK